MCNGVSSPDCSVQLSLSPCSTKISGRNNTHHRFNGLLVQRSHQGCQVWRMFASQKTVFSNLITESSFQCFYSKITLTIDRDIPKRSHYNTWLSDILLFTGSRISITSHENNPLVNSRPEIHLILVKHTKHAINEQGKSKVYWNVAMSYCIVCLTLINTKNHQHSEGTFWYFGSYCFANKLWSN